MLAAETEFAQSAPMPADAALSVRLYRTWDEVEQFRGDWNRLLEENPSSSIFQTPEWLAAWWQAFAQDRSLLCLLFADSCGTIVGIAPLYVDTVRFLGLSLATLRMVGAASGDSDRLDFIVSPGYEGQCAEAFMEWLAEYKNWHLCELETLPQNSVIGQALVRRIQAFGWKIGSTLTPNFIVDLPMTWPQYLSTLEPSFRPLLTRYPKRLQSRFSVTFTRCERVEELKEQLPSLFDLHQMRWTGRGEIGAFASSERRNFYYRMATAFLQRGWLEFWWLELDGKTVGAQFCFRHNNTVSLLQEGFDPKYADEKIGYALKAHLLQNMIRSGATRYDFLGGADPYKAKFGARQENYLNLSIAGPSHLGRFYLAWQKQKRRAKAWLKNRLWVAAARRGPSPRPSL
jgi:CelD/BcsL family acetyltransferase involved in cellulose biosynthesis